MPIPDKYFKPSAIGCASALSTFAAFGGGIYRGLCASNGTPIEPSLEKILMFGPSAVSVPIAYSLGIKMVNDPEMRAQLPPIPQGSEGCYAGCSSVLTAGALYLAHQAGYLAGNWLGKHS